MARVLMLKLFLAFLGLSVPAGPVRGQDEVAPARGFRLEKSWQIGDSELQLFGSEPKAGWDPYAEQRLDVRVLGNVKLSITDGSIVIDDWMAPSEDAPFPPIGTNVTGGTDPQVIVQTYSLGASCCFSFFVLDLGRLPGLIPLPIGAKHGVVFRQQGDGGPWTAVGSDGSYAYWPQGFPSSPAPRVILRYQHGGWRLAAEFMRKPAPSPQSVREAARAMRGDPDWDELAPPHLWWRVLELVYEGNLAAAEAFFDEAWRPGKPGREEFRRMLFACKLRESPFWPDIAAMNGVEPLPADGKCERLR